MIWGEILTNKLDTLYNIALKDNIEINNYHFSTSKKAMCARIDQYKFILLDKPKIDSSTEETELLAEEIGHYKTGSLYMIEATYNHPFSKSNISHYETKARRWKIKKLLPYKELQQAISKGILESYDLAEYFGLSESFIKEAVNYYTNIKKIASHPY